MAKQSQLLEGKSRARPHHDFSEFKSRFERERPEQARAIQDSVRPAHEKRALEAEKQIGLLEKAAAQSKTPRSCQAELERFASGTVKQKDVMAYLQQKNPELSDKIQVIWLH